MNKREKREDTIERVLMSNHKMKNIIMGCTTMEQLESALRCLRNYERLMQNSHIYPMLTKQEALGISNGFLSLIRLKRRGLRDF